MTKDIASKQASPLTAPGAVRRGFEEPTTKEDLIIPRAKLLQALSPEVIEESQSPDGKDLKQGMIINSITKDILPVEFIPVFKFSNWIRFNPRNTQDPNYLKDYDPGAVIWRSSDPLDPKVQEEAKFGPNGERPAATKFLNFFAYFPGSEMPVIVSFSNTSYKAGKQLLSLCQFTQGDMFSRKYKLGSKQVKSEMGVYFVLTVEPSGMAAEADYKTAEALWNTFAAKSKDIQVHSEEVEGTEDSPF